MQKIRKTRFIVLGAFIALLFLLTACSSSSLSGTYEGSQDGLPVSLEFSGGNKVKTNILGLPVDGTYKVSGDRITITLTVSILGISQSQDITGKIDGDKIIFADVTFTKKGSSQLSNADLLEEAGIQVDNYVISSNQDSSDDRGDESLQTNNVSTLSLPLIIRNNVATIGWTINADGTARSWDGEGWFYNARSIHMIEPSSAFSYNEHTVFVITNDNFLWGFGRNNKGQLGDNTGVDNFDEYRYILDDVANLHIVTDDLVFAIKTDKTLWGWGTGLKNMKSDLAEDKMYAPVELLNNVIDVYLDNNLRCILQADGTLWSWQKGSFYIAMTGVKEIHSAKYGSNVLVIKGDNSLWELDLSNTHNSFILENVEKVYPDSNVSMAVTHDGVLYEWNTKDKLPVERLKNVKEAYQPNITSINQNEWFGFAIKNDDTLWGWGNNNSGQLGDGSKINRSEPVKIADNVNKIIENRENCGAYLSTNGEIYCWGSSLGGNSFNAKPTLIYTGVKEAYFTETANFSTRYAIIYFNSGLVRIGMLFGDGFNITYFGKLDIEYEIENVKQIVRVDLVRNRANGIIKKTNHYFETTNGLWYGEDIEFCFPKYRDFQIPRGFKFENSNSQMAASTHTPLKKIKVQVDVLDTIKIYDIETDKSYLVQALDEINLVKYDENYFLETVDDITANPSKQQWWVITKSGEPIMTGLEDTVIVDGDQYGIKLMGAAILWELANITEVGNIDCYLEGVHRRIEYKHGKEGAQDEFRAWLDGEELAELNGRRICSSIYSIFIDSSTDTGKPATSPNYKFIITLLNGTTQTMELHSINERDYLIVYNGENTGYIALKSSIYDNVLRKFEMLDKGEDLPR